MLNFILPKIQIEKWKYNKEYQIYVSSLGNFKKKNKQNIKCMIAKSSGYCVIRTKKGVVSAHRLVLMTFKPTKNMKELTVDHLDHNKKNNNLNNLEWVSSEINKIRAINDLTEEQVIDEPQRYKIQSHGLTFDTIDACATWVLQNSGCIYSKDQPNLTNIKKRICQAIKEDTLYCKRKWKMILI